MSTLEATAVANAAHSQVESCHDEASWPAKGGSFAGPLRVEKTACTMLPGECRVRITDAGVVVDGKYDPPGSGLYALLATIVSVVALVAMVASFNAGAAPGWLVWYLIIVVIRRQQVSFNLSDAESVVVDRATSRIAFQMDFRDRQHWFAIQLGDGFDQVSDHLHQILPEKLQTKQIRGASKTPIVILVGIILAAMTATAYFLLTQSF